MSSLPITIDRRDTNQGQLTPELDANSRPPSTEPPLADNFSESKRVVDAPMPSSASQAPTVTDEALLLVDWDGPDDPKNPKNWREAKKWTVAMTMSLFTLMSALSSSMVAPAAFQIAADLNITQSVEVSMTISIFVLAYAVGPLFLGPLSEIYGRVIVLQLANATFLAFNLGCGFAQNKSQFMAFRFMAGLGGSAPLSVGGGVLSDLWNADKRGKAVGVYSLAPLLGPVIGPVAGGFVAQYSTWRWVFWAITIADSVVQGAGLLLLKETYAPTLLKRKAKRIRAQMNTEKGDGNTLVVQTIYEQRQGDVTWREWLIRSLIRPFSLFVQEPIIQLFGVYLAFVYGVLYISLTTLPRIFTEVYHQKPGILGLHYIALGLGLTTAAQINSITIDHVYRILTNKNGGIGKPEYRLLPIIPGTFCLPIGLLIAGWTAQEHTHWIGPDIGFFFLGVGSASVFQGLQAYVIDSFPQYAASALAAVSCFRSLAGFGFPLFAPYMYDALGYGKGDTILAAFCLGVGSPALILFWLYGEKIRGMSRRARSTVHVTPPDAEKLTGGPNAA
ncbi:MFS polyamine transporter [Irpex rosettiformis]|uniref:MFS polyamine transporter n=1 Tax=Irpex rosettiformis TaxID=378272 RepID=A0ACB8U8G4_9APHY|nr:MFS polyamine transporter [Irpex rosettiformis]